MLNLLASTGTQCSSSMHRYFASREPSSREAWMNPISSRQANCMANQSVLDTLFTSWSKHCRCYWLVAEMSSFTMNSSRGNGVAFTFWLPCRGCFQWLLCPNTILSEPSGLRLAIVQAMRNRAQQLERPLRRRFFYSSFSWFSLSKRTQSCISYKNYYDEQVLLMSSKRRLLPMVQALFFRERHKGMRLKENLYLSLVSYCRYCIKGKKSRWATESSTWLSQEMSLKWANTSATKGASTQSSNQCLSQELKCSMFRWAWMSLRIRCWQRAGSGDKRMSTKTRRWAGKSSLSIGTELTNTTDTLFSDSLFRSRRLSTKRSIFQRYQKSASIIQKGPLALLRSSLVMVGRESRKSEREWKGGRSRSRVWLSWQCSSQSRQALLASSRHCTVTAVLAVLSSNCFRVTMFYSPVLIRLMFCRLRRQCRSNSVSSQMVILYKQNMDIERPWFAVLEERPAREEESEQAIRGPDFNCISSLEELQRQSTSLGLQSANLESAVDELNRMLSWRLSDVAPTENEPDHLLEETTRKAYRCKVFLGVQGHFMQTGLKDIVSYLAQHRMVDVLVTDATGVYADLLSCFQEEQALQDWLFPLLDQVQCPLSGQALLSLLGQHLSQFPSSVLYQCRRRDIPVICPNLGSCELGELLLSYEDQARPLTLDYVGDIRCICGLAVKARATGALILGGGVIKHHILNSNIWKNGLDYAVFLNTGTDQDASDSGAQISEAITWGKVKAHSRFSKVFSDPTLVFPQLVYRTFHQRRAEYE